MESKNLASRSSGATMVETAIALPLVLLVGAFLCELYFASVRYFVASDGFAIASRRLAIPATVLSGDLNNAQPTCADLVEQTMRTRAISTNSGLQGLRISVKQISGRELAFQVSVQNDCVVCRAAGVHFPITYNFDSTIQVPSGELSCKPDS